MKKLIKIIFAVVILFIVVSSVCVSVIIADAVKLPRKILGFYEDIKVYVVADDTKTEVTEHIDKLHLMDIFGSMRFYEITLENQESCPFYDGDRIEFENIYSNKIISIYPALDSCANYKINCKHYYLYYDTANLLREDFEQIARKYGMRFIMD